jgi:hypothetical protein
MKPIYTLCGKMQLLIIKADGVCSYHRVLKGLVEIHFATSRMKLSLNRFIRVRYTDTSTISDSVVHYFMQFVKRNGV